MGARFWSVSTPDQLAQSDLRPLGLMTSLPIYWNEGDAFNDLSAENVQLPWVRATLEQRYRILPLDLLYAGEGAGSIDELDALAIIQPRGLSPADNAALDAWVRGGGHVLIVLDPLLSGEYDAPLGDPRHPTVSALVPPVVTRWGLSLSFDDAQDEVPRLVQWDEVTVPVLVAGTLSQLKQGDPSAKGDCALSAQGMFAQCKIGSGSAVIMADAALFEPRVGNAEAQDAILALFAKALP
ncbi:MAG: hypothetical protein ABJ242_12755 [Marinomonas sp.]